MIDPQEVAQLEAQMQAMAWENVTLEPDPLEVQRLDQELPQEWMQTLAAEQEAEYSPDELEDLLHSDLNIPEGDIDKNARKALNELDLDLGAIAQERDPNLDSDLHHEQDVDFGR